jgi:hypothetical protein
MTIVPTRFGQTNNLLTFADKYGKQIENWHGVDAQATARLSGLMVQGGISTGPSPDRHLRRASCACRS